MVTFREDMMRVTEINMFSDSLMSVENFISVILALQREAQGGLKGEVQRAWFTLSNHSGEMTEI